MGAIGNGTANSRAAVPRLTGDLVGDREGDGGGINDNADGPLGDADAKVLVNEEAFIVVSCGKSARGMLGSVVTSLCS